MTGLVKINCIYIVNKQATCDLEDYCNIVYDFVLSLILHTSVIECDTLLDMKVHKCKSTFILWTQIQNQK